MHVITAAAENENDFFIVLTSECLKLFNMLIHAMLQQLFGSYVLHSYLISETHGEVGVPTLIGMGCNQTKYS